MKNTLLILLLLVSGLCLFGLVMLDAMAMKSAGEDRLRSQLKFLFCGVLLFGLLVRKDYRWLERRSVLWVLAGVGGGLLLAVLLVGSRSHGASRWFHGFGQPSELAKPVVVTLLAACLARRDERQILTFKVGFLAPLLLGVVPAFLVFLEPDWGTAILLGTVTLAMLLLAGVRWRHVLATVAGAAGFFWLMVRHDSVRMERILVFRDPEAHREGAGWQVWQGLLAMSGGGILGRFWNGSPHLYGFVPEQQTDFIFTCIGQETGLWGTTLVLALFLGVFLCGLKITIHARDRFGAFLAAGCTMMITLQAGLNIAVATSIIPNKGLPLPFISYGGSSLLGMFILVGLLGSVAWHSRGAGRVPPIGPNSV